MEFGFLKVLVIVVVGYGIMFGLLKKKKIGRVIAGMIFVPVALAVAFTYVKDIMSEFSPLESAAMVVGLGMVVLLLLLISTTFGREIVASFIGALLYDGVKSISRIFLRLFRKR